MAEYHVQEHLLNELERRHRFETDVSAEPLLCSYARNAVPGEALADDFDTVSSFEFEELVLADETDEEDWLERQAENPLQRSRRSRGW